MPPDRLPNPATSAQIIPTHVRRTPSSGILPLQLRGVVPACAQPCLATYITQDYDCSSHGTACLCQNYSAQGYTLGELAYLCLQQACERPTRGQSLDQYNICSAIPDAASAKHSVLSAPATRPSRQSTATLRTTTAQEPSDSPRATSGSPNGMPNAVSGKGSTVTMGLPSQTRSVPRSSATAAAAASPSTQPSDLSAPEAVGVSMGVLAFVLLLLAAAYFFWCMRRGRTKQENDREAGDYSNKPETRQSTVLTIRPAPDVRGVNRETVCCWQQLGSGSMQKKARNAKDSPASIGSHGSTQTVAQLLPKRPDNAALSKDSRGRSGSSDTTATEFEENTNALRPSSKSLGWPTHLQASEDSPPKVTQVHRIPPPVGRRTQAHVRGSLVKMPKSSIRPPVIPNQLAIAIPPVPKLEEDVRYDEPRTSSVSRSRSQGSSTSLLNYYASSEAGITPSPDLVDSPARMDVDYLPPDIVVLQPARTRSSTRKDSAASDTSFESTDSDEPTPPDERQLTPVQESPVAERSPIRDIRYPKIPRSANQAVPRSPSYGNAMSSSLHSPREPKALGTQGTYRSYPLRQNHAPGWPLPNTITPDRQINTGSALSGSTLAEKRRGHDAAHDLELKLDKNHTAYTPFNRVYPAALQKPAYAGEQNPRYRQQESPLKGYGRVASSPRKTAHEQQRAREQAGDRRVPKAMGSPYWEPKLTPQKRGDDLYLQVGIATPMQASFDS